MGKVAVQRIDAQMGWPRQKLNLRNAYERVLGKAPSPELSPATASHHKA
jgi:hypothetical protein